MIAAVALACPRCKRVLEPHSWHDAGSGMCRRCEMSFEFFSFPALTASRSHVAPQAAALAEDSVCFFHADNRAAAICEGCGRFLCSVCTVDYTGRKLCPACIAAGAASESDPVVRERPLYDSLALTLAVLPLLVWPLTLVTAPVTLGFVVYGWKKPVSIVRGGSRTRFVIAAVLALLEIAGWVVLFTYLGTRRR